jgi:sugar lactone lactonase YvrE
MNLRFKPVASPYCFLEAPRSDGRVLWFTDLLLGGLHRLSPDGEIQVFLKDSKHIGGVVINEDGAIICGGSAGLSWVYPETGETGILLNSLNGQPLPGVNDMYPDGQGGLYFGTLSHAGEYGRPPSLTALYRMTAHGEVTLLRDELKFSNGIGLSPDGRRLYHNESLLGTFVYDVRADGGIENRAVFSSKEDCDGLVVDAGGGVWIAYFATGELIRYRRDGTLDCHVPVPHKVVTSACFGGADNRDLYVTTAGNTGLDALMKGINPPREAAVFHARVDIPGLVVPRTRFHPGKHGA